jgi:hypothetical protein
MLATVAVRRSSSSFDFGISLLDGERGRQKGPELRFPFGFTLKMIINNEGASSFDYNEYSLSSSEVSFQVPLLPCAVHTVAARMLVSIALGRKKVSRGYNSMALYRLTW